VRTSAINRVDDERPSATAANPRASRLEGEAVARPGTKEKSSRIKKKRWKLRHLAAMIVLGLIFGFGVDAGLGYFSPEAIEKRQEQAKIRRDVNSRLERARQFVVDNNLNSAAYELIKALEVDPKSAKTYFELGRVYAKQASYDQALVVLENAIKLDPKFALAYAEIGDIHQARGNLRIAHEFLKKAAALDQKNTRIRSELKKLETKMRRR
jgi:Tfp pilus assembly protein PilF